MDDLILARQRRVERLLGALVALTALLLVGLGVGGVLAWREYSRFRSTAQAALGDRDVPALVEDVTARQRRATERLAAMNADAKKQIATFERRAAEIRTKDSGGPVDAASKALVLLDLMNDQSLFGLKQLAAMQDAAVKAAGADEAPRDDQASGEREAPKSSARKPPRQAAPRGSGTR